MTSIDRNRIRVLLQDNSLSYREIARRAGCSDWSVRAVAREALPPELRNMPSHTADELSMSWSGVIWLTATGVVIVLLAIWFTPHTDTRY